MTLSMSRATRAVSWPQAATHTGVLLVTGTFVALAQGRQSRHHRQQIEREVAEQQEEEKRLKDERGFSQGENRETSQGASRASTYRIATRGKGRISPGEAEQARLQQLREEKERLARLQQLREEKERLLREQAKQTRLQQLREEKERLLQEQAEQTRLEQLRLEAKEQLLKEQAEQTRLEKERLMQQQAEQARLPELRQAAPKPSITCGTQATDTLIDRSSQPSSQPIFPAADRMSPGEETIDRALRDEESMQIQRALSREALEEEQAVLKLKELQAQEARDAEEMAKLEARMQQRQLESQAQAKAALLARSRSQSSFCSEPATSAGSPPAPSTQISR